MHPPRFGSEVEANVVRVFLDLPSQRCGSLSKGRDAAGSDEAIVRFAPDRRETTAGAIMDFSTSATPQTGQAS
jgi:hypothetical protein